MRIEDNLLNCENSKVACEGVVEGLVDISAYRMELLYGVGEEVAKAYFDNRDVGSEYAWIDGWMDGWMDGYAAYQA